MLALVSLSVLRAEDAAAPPREPDAKRAEAYLVKICRIGPRPSGSQGMLEQQKVLRDHFANLGAQVRFQSFDAAHPLNGEPVRMNNIIVSWHPQAKDRVLIACHYDTRPFPDRDAINPRGRFIGANDGGSGVALLMELGNHMQAIKPAMGIDFVFFDGEELVYNERGTYFLGSEHFAREYVRNPPEHRYSAGILVDMIGDRNLTVYQERYSVQHARGLCSQLWEIARQLEIQEFVPRVGYEVRDDHLPLNETARIPTCDIIDFNYPAWHTTRDLPNQCSGESLAKVGKVLLAWMERYKPPAAAPANG